MVERSRAILIYAGKATNTILYAARFIWLLLPTVEHYKSNVTVGKPKWQKYSYKYLHSA